MNMTRKLAVVAGLALFCAQPASADEEWDKLETEYEQAHQKWEKAMEKLQGEGEGGMMHFNPATLPPHPIEEFRPRFRTYAEKHEGKPAAMPALGHMLAPGFGLPGMGGANKSAEWALTQLKDHHAADPQLQDYLEGVRMAVMSVGEEPVIEFMEAVAGKNPDRETKGSARLAMAEILYEGSPFAMMMGMSDTAETKAKKKRAVKILRDIKREFVGTELAEQADDFLFAIDHLQVGMKAPEIVGKDADGKEIRLSQFDGKVVAVVFWATWCVPCIQMLPHERQLMEKHADKPFTILGINVDNTLADFKKTMKKEKITWPTIYDGSPQVSKITKKWRVRSFPTIYVIDHKGLIRYKHLMPFQLESAVNDLVAKAVEDDKGSGGNGQVGQGG
jgi:thiol-disulfide isomerase/thioredoxin